MTPPNRLAHSSPSFKVYYISQTCTSPPLNELCSYSVYTPMLRSSIFTMFLTDLTPCVPKVQPPDMGDSGRHPRQRPRNYNNQKKQQDTHIRLRQQHKDQPNNLPQQDNPQHQAQRPQVKPLTTPPYESSRNTQKSTASKPCELPQNKTLQHPCKLPQTKKSNA